MSVIEDARRLLAEGPVCDSCLGRAVADRSHGLRNDERGFALRVTVALIEDTPAEPPDPLSCWVCEGYSSVVDELATAVAEALEGIEVGTYQVGSRVPPLVEENDRLFREEAGIDPEAGDSIGRDLNREVGRRVGAAIGAEVDFDRPDVVCVLELGAVDPLAIADGASVSGHAVDVQVNPAFVYGRYRKLERNIPQTEWPCRDCGGSGTRLESDGPTDCPGCDGTGYRYDTSVEQLVAPPVVSAMDGETGTFHGAGREDVDALMLGTGRPFVLEVTRPRVRTPDTDRLEREINESAADRVAVSDLRLATHEMVERVKELPASKRYRASVSFAESVDGAAFDAALRTLSGATIEQRTPERVDHRRADRVRKRSVYEADGDHEGPQSATVTVHGEGGLYVKELISGDDGRTNPSLAGELGVAASVTALDVLAVEGEDEPFERPDLFFEHNG